MNDELRSILTGTIVVDMIALAAVWLTIRRRTLPAAELAEVCFIPWYVGCIALQFVHFSEEFINGLHWRLPELIGLAPWPPRFFVNFNLALLAIWLFSVPLVRRGFRPAFFAAWFLSLAAIANAVLHPVVAIWAGGYFPGLWTALPLGAAGMVLWRRLLRATLPAA